jgi:O-antigen/teichoic acid export membrane protein
LRNLKEYTSDGKINSVSQLNRNILANFLGKGWNAIMLVALVPRYIQVLGIEAYGLIGFFATLQAVFSLLDLGLSTTLNRETARLSARTDSEQEIRDLVRTLEIIYWFVAVVIIFLVALLVPLVAGYWVNAQHLSTDTIRQSVFLIGVVIALEFPFALYSGGLIGLQRQVQLNSIVVTIATLRGLGSLLVLSFISPTIQAFFIWNAIVSLAQTFLSAIFLWRGLPKAAAPARFHGALLATIWRFAAGLTGISFLSVLLTQMDKIVLSKLLTLEVFGYYTLAAVVASSLYMIINPIFTALFPRLSQLVARDATEEVITLYHNSCQLMSVILLPVAIVVALFSKDILLVWTRDPQIVAQTHLLVSLLVVGTAFNGLMMIPYALQLAYGWTKLAFYQNLVAVLLLGPLMFWATRHYGAVGAAAIWIALNAGYVLIGIQVMHKRLLGGEKLRWYVQDVGLPLLATVAVASVGRWFFPTQASIVTIIAWLLPISALAIAASVIVAPFASNQIKAFFS